MHSFSWKMVPTIVHVRVGVLFQKQERQSSNDGASYTCLYSMFTTVELPVL